MLDADRPRYVDRWRMQGSLQPFAARGARMWGFVFRAQLDHLVDLCDRYLNVPGHGAADYTPVLPFVVLTFTQIQQLSPKNPPYSAIGRASESEAVFWLFAPAYEMGAPMRFTWFTPYVFVDNPLAIAEGREIYGFPKEMGWFSGFPAGRRLPVRLTVDAFGVQRFDNSAPLAQQRLFEVQRTPAHDANAAGSWTTRLEAGLELMQRLLAPEADNFHQIAAEFPPGLWPPHGTTAFLKQFPSAADSSIPSYQALVEAPVEVDSFHGGGLLDGSYELRIRDCATHPLCNDLGLQNRQRAILSYWLDFDFTLGSGSETPFVATPHSLAVAPSPWNRISTAWRELRSSVFDMAVGLVNRNAVAATLTGPAPRRATARSQRRRTPTASTKKGRKKRQGAQRTKIAILGGGVGAMTAAFFLTDRKNWDQKYDITVYQIGERLGGKGDTGRNLDEHARIEEHGLHMWFGFYYNALPMMQKCYRELTGKADAWEEAFKPHEYIVLEEYFQKRWIHYPLSFPPKPGPPLHPWEYVSEVLRWMRDTFVASPLAAALHHAPLEGVAEPEWWPRLHAKLSEAGFTLIHHPARFLGGALALTGLFGSTPPAHGSEDHTFLLALVERYRHWLWQEVETQLVENDTARRLWIALDLGVAFVRGMLEDQVVTKGFDSIDAYDVREWFRKHGASDLSMESAWIRTLYSQAFAFRKGDPAQPSIAAGAVLRATMRMLFGYQGAVMWKMQAGMGDVIFAPFYEVLKRRGVKFKFFHRVRALHLAADKRSVDRISIGCQAHVVGKEYSPLITVKGRKCWPGEPDYTQLVEGEAMRKLDADLESWWSTWGPEREEALTLRKGIDFDLVVLGISVGALPAICGELIAADKRWRDMVTRVETVRTQAFQLWLKPTLAELGWNQPGPVSTAYVEPIDTWAEMNQTRDAENWPADDAPGLIAYFCGPMKDSRSEPAPFTHPEFPEQQRALVYRTMKDFLTRHIGHLWPAGTRAGHPNALKWELLMAPKNCRGENRLKTQFWTANIDPSDRYVLALPGTTQYRLRSDESGFDNLYLAGDWTRNALNAGCVEAAVTSGMRVAQTISGHPKQIIGETDFPR